ncbi:MAG: hypothetical protein AAGA68_27465 [Pseudomonadota bacterium]
MLLEQHPDWVVVKLDEANAFNRIERATVIERRLAAGGEIARLECLLAASLGPAGDLVHGGELAPFKSEHSGRQGMPSFPSAYAVASLPELQVLDAAPGVACARAYFDDTFVFAPATPQLFEAIRA